MKTLLCADFEFYDAIYSKIPERNHEIQMDYVADGKQALEKLSERRYDFLITTIVMPEINGFELVDKIRESPDKYGNPKIATLTGLTGDIIMEHVNMRGMVYIDRYERKLEDILLDVDKFLN